MNFNERVWELTKKIPKGKVSTYKEISRAMNTRAYQAIGQALRRNPYAPTVPCHRVVKNNGEVGGFGGKWENSEKVKMLRKEGVRIDENKIDLSKFFQKLY